MTTIMRSLRTRLMQGTLPVLRKYPTIKSLAKSADAYLDVARHSVAAVLPQIIQPDPREIYITLTANCNLRCIGCRYGREFHAGAQLPLQIVLNLLDDCRTFGIKSIRLYGGEPLLYKDLPRVVEHARALGLNPWLTTNGILLKEKVDALYAAGLRAISIGFYGTGEPYDAYVQRENQFARMEQGVAYVRERYGMNIELTLGWLLMRPTCSLEAVHGMWSFAEKYKMKIGISLIHYSLPYFTEGPNGELQFHPEDRDAIEEVVAELIRLKESQPARLEQSPMALRSIPDWLLNGPQMNVPCERYRLLWIGANGVVQMCYVTFELGNLHEKRLSEMLFTREHRKASRDAFELNCPHCHCSYHKRIESHLPSRVRYAA